MATSKQAERGENDNRGIAARLMNEAVRVPGFPQIIVTRHFLYHWLKAQGWNEGRPNSTQNNYCFQSLDYAVFGRPTVDAPLTDEAERDRLLGMMSADLQRRKAA